MVVTAGTWFSISAVLHMPSKRDEVTPQKGKVKYK
jgi:hypothetical protein